MIPDNNIICRLATNILLCTQDLPDSHLLYTQKKINLPDIVIAEEICKPLIYTFLLFAKPVVQSVAAGVENRRSLVRSPVLHSNPYLHIYSF